MTTLHSPTWLLLSVAILLAATATAATDDAPVVAEAAAAADAAPVVAEAAAPLDDSSSVSYAQRYFNVTSYDAALKADAVIAAVKASASYKPPPGAR